MEQAKINLYMSQFKNSIPNEKQVILKNALTKSNDECEEALSFIKLKNPTLILIISIFFGAFGVDRFMLGEIGLGVCKLLLSGLTFGIWPLIDIFLTHSKAKEINLQNILLALN